MGQRLRYHGAKDFCNEVATDSRLPAERSGFMERIDISLNGASLRRAYALWLSLALFFGWVSIGASIPGSQASQLCLRATTGLTFLACSLPPLKSLLHGRSSSLACMACIGLSIVFRAMGALWGADALLICAGGATGVAFALFARLWFGRYRGSGSDLLIVLLLASCLANVLYEGGALGEGAAFVLSSVVPFLGLIAYAAGTVGIPTPKDSPHPHGQSSTTAAQRSFWIQTVALLLCNFASGIASYSNQATRVPTFVSIIVLLSLASILLIVGLPRREILFSGLVIVICLCIIVSFVAPQTGAWPLGFARTGFWLIMYYSMAWFYDKARPQEGVMSPVCLRGFTMIYLSSAVANAVGQSLDAQSAGIVTLGLLVAALVIAFLDASISREPEAPSLDTPLDSTPLLPIEDRIAHIANGYQLTDTEREVLGYLAKGHSLRGTAEQVHLSESSAKYHRRNIYQKLGISSREELIELVNRAE